MANVAFCNYYILYILVRRRLRLSLHLIPPAACLEFPRPMLHASYWDLGRYLLCFEGNTHTLLSRIYRSRNVNKFNHPTHHLPINQTTTLAPCLLLLYIEGSCISLAKHADPYLVLSALLPTLQPNTVGYGINSCLYLQTNQITNIYHSASELPWRHNIDPSASFEPILHTQGQGGGKMPLGFLWRMKTKNSTCRIRCRRVYLFPVSSCSR